jgi:hypothetical protein
MNEKQLSALRNWQSLNKLLNDLTENEIKEMLDDELKQRVQRTTFIERLHQRFCILRAQRERSAMMKK